MSKDSQGRKSGKGDGKKIDIRKKVTEVVSRVTKIEEKDITAEKLIRDDLGVDSMQAIETLAILEKELGILVEPDKAFNVATVNELFNLIEGYYANKGDRPLL